MQGDAGYAGDAGDGDGGHWGPGRQHEFGPWGDTTSTEAIAAIQREHVSNIKYNTIYCNYMNHVS